MDAWSSDGTFPAISDREFEALTHADGRQRARYFRTRVASSGWLCTWGSEEDVDLWADEDGNETVALWPHPRYAELSYRGELNEGSRIVHRELSKFMDVNLPVIAFDGLRLGIFPVDDNFATVFSPRDFTAWMDEALWG